MGSRRIKDELMDRGITEKINRKKVQRLMRKMGIMTLYPKQKTSLPGKGHQIYPYLLKGLTIDRSNQVWATDVTLGTEPRFGSEALHFTISNFLDTPGRSYDIFSDGRKLVAIQRAEPAQDGEIHILANWLSTLE